MARSRFPLTLDASGACRRAGRLFRGCPLPHPKPQAPDAPDPGDPGGDGRVHPPVLGRLGSELLQGGEAEINAGGGKTGGLEVGTKLLQRRPGEGTAAEGQEVVERLPVRPPGVLGRHGVQHQGLEAGHDLFRPPAGAFLPFWAWFGIGNEVGHFGSWPPSGGPGSPPPAPVVINDSPPYGCSTCGSPAFHD
jgi:hypothetical protein